MVRADSEISLGVMYVGRRESAEFWACLVGRASLGGDDAQVCGLWTMRRDVSTSDRRVRPGVESMLVTEHIAGPPVLVESIDVASPGDWVVHDVRIDGRSVFANTSRFAGVDVAGEALQEMGQLGMYLGTAREKVELLVSYVGGDEAGAAFQFTILGSSEGSSRDPHARH